MPNDEAGMMVVEAGQVEERMEQDEESNNPALDGSSSAGLAPLTRPQYKPLPANEMEVRFCGRREGGRGGREGGMDGGGGGEVEREVRARRGQASRRKHAKQQQGWHSLSSCLDLPLCVWYLHLST